MLSDEKASISPVSYAAQRKQRKHRAIYGSAATVPAFQSVKKNKDEAWSVLSYLPLFVRSHWRFLGSLVLFAVACALILYAEIVRGWNEALFLKVRQKTIQTTCEPQEKYDTELVYVSCPVVYMHDFRNQLAATFLRNMAADIDLSGLSFELQTEIYQWREIAHCDGCEPQYKDADGNCMNGHSFPSCRYTFEKAWLTKPLSSSGFACAVESQRCEFPAGGFAAVRNEGSIPPELKSFKKFAESVSIGTNPGRYYLSPELVAQFPARTIPLLFPKDDLPIVSGKTTSLVGTRNQELRVEKDPASSEPSIGDVRSKVSLIDFYNQTSERTVSVVAKQGSYIYGSRHRTLVPWDSGIDSWENGSEIRVSWLHEGASSFHTMISNERTAALKGVSATITHLRLWGFVCVFLGLFLLFGPLAKVWANKRIQIGRCSSFRDIVLVFSILTALALVIACVLAALPWLHYWPLCGGILLGVSFFLFVLAGVLLRFLDSWANLQVALLEWKGVSSNAPGVDTSLQISSPREDNSMEDYERGVLDEDVVPSHSRPLVERYSAVNYGAAEETSGYAP